MGKESKTSRGDARLHDAAMRVGRQYAQTEFKDVKSRGGTIPAKSQEENARGIFRAVFKALKGASQTGGRDIEGIERAARKARAIREVEER